MQNLFDAQASKKAINLNINSDLLAKAKEFKINFSAEFEKALAEIVRQKQKALWLQENRRAIGKYNDFVEENGVFSDDFRNF